MTNKKESRWPILEDSTLMIPITVYGMRVKFVDLENNVVSTKDFPYRKKHTDLRKDFAEPNNLQILEMKSTKQEHLINYNDLVSSGQLVKITENKNGVIQ